MTGIPDLLAAADALEKAAPGYDQGQRTSAYDAAQQRIITGREVDCSFGCGIIAHKAGYPVDLSGIFTGNFKVRFVAAGFIAIPFDGKLASVKPGDFLLGAGHVIFAGDRGLWWSAIGDENGRSSGGKAGDQTGREVMWVKPYLRSKGWQWILRPPAQVATLAAQSDAWTHEVVGCSWLNVRKTPPVEGRLGAIANAVEMGTRLRIVGYSGSWVEVVTDDAVTGWVSNAYVHKIGG